MTILYTLTILTTGTMLTYFFCKEMDLLKRFSVGFGLGLLLFSLVHFGLIAFGSPLNKLNVIITTVIILAVSLLSNFKNSHLLKDLKKITFRSNQWFVKGERKYLFALILIVSFLTFTISLFWPISEWDALTLYDFRGRLYSEGLLFSDVQDLDKFDTYNPGYYFSYPILTSIIHASYYVLGSAHPQIIYPLIFVSLVVFFYKSLSQYVHRDIAFLLTGILASINTYVSHASVPYTNLPYTYYYFVSTILLIEAVYRKNSLGLLVLSGFFLGGSSWVRSVEPFYIVNILLIIYLFIFKKVNFVALLSLILPVSLIRMAWKDIQNQYTTSSFLNNINVDQLLTNIFTVLPNIISKAISAYLSFVYKNSVIFLILVICTLLIFVNTKKVKKSVEKLMLIIIYSDLMIIFVGTLFVGLVLVGRNEIYDSINRFGIFLYPLILFVSGLSLKTIVESKNK